MLQQLQHPTEADATVNDAFRPVSRFFDRITRPGQRALPHAMRVLTDPIDTGAVVLSLPQDVQSHAFDYPAEFFARRDWVIRRPVPDADEVDAVARLLAQARTPVVIAGGGVIYSGATAELEALADAAGIPVLETMAGKGAVQQRAWWQLGGIRLEGAYTPATASVPWNSLLPMARDAGLFASRDALFEPQASGWRRSSSGNSAQRRRRSVSAAPAGTAPGLAVQAAPARPPGRDEFARSPGGSRSGRPRSTRTPRSTARRCRRATTSSGCIASIMENRSSKP